MDALAGERGIQHPEQLRSRPMQVFALAMLTLAVADLRGTSLDRRRDAEAFLWPRTPEGRAHLAWVDELTGLPLGALQAMLRNARCRVT